MDDFQGDGMKVGIEKLPERENRMILRSLDLSQYQRVTDGQTDRQTDTPPIAAKSSFRFGLVVTRWF